MDEFNVHHMWGISPYLDLWAAQQAAVSATGPTAALQLQMAFLQVCPYDCRHTLATISSHAAHVLAAAPHQQQPCQQLELFVYESEPESLARHMLLLAVLVDASFTTRERAEMFLELHGNILLRQRTADWVCRTSRQLEDAVAACPKAQVDPQQHQQQQTSREEDPIQAVLGLFDFSMLRYKERDSLLETFQHYRSKAGFGMTDAWEGRCRKWYGDRYDCRQNLIDWDYHMRLAQRGTPFLDPAAGSIIHFFHFRHWRLTGVAYELRESSYTATNTSMLATAYGRTREYKDRNLRDVGRSISAYGYWGDILNPPYHAFGTVADDLALFKQVNKQFSHTSVDVAEHVVLGFIKALCSTAATTAGAGASAGAAANASAGSIEGSNSSSAGAHRARAARGPTSLEQLQAGSSEGNNSQQQEQQEDCQQQQQEQQDNSQQQHQQDSSQQQEQQQDNGQQLQQQDSSQQQQEQQNNSQGQQQEQEKQDSNQQQQQDSSKGRGLKEDTDPVRPDATSAADQAAAGALAGMSLQQQQQDQQQHQQQQQQPKCTGNEPGARTAAAQAAAEAVRVAAAAVQALAGHVKIHLLTGDLPRAVTGRAAFAQRFAAATVGHRHVHLLGPAGGLPAVMCPGAPVFVETAANMVQLSKEQVAAFDSKLLELAQAAGFQQHPAFTQPGTQQQSGVAGWRLPPGYVVLRAT